MTPDETLATLLVLSNRMPAEHVIPDRAMALAWHPTVRAYDSGAALNVAYAWPDKAFPAAGDFLSALQAEARRCAATGSPDPSQLQRERPTSAQREKVHALVDLAKRALHDKAARTQLLGASDEIDEDF